MLTPVARLTQVFLWHAGTPGAQFTIVYEPPVTIRALAAELGITMSFLHRKVRDKKIPGFTVGDQTCVSPETAQRIKTWWEQKRPHERWPDFTKPDTPNDD